MVASSPSSDLPDYRAKSVGDEPVTSVLPDGDIAFDPHGFSSSDDELLASLGYKPEFKRDFNLYTTFSVSFAVLGLLPSFASTLYYGMGYAGTAGMTWGWIVAMFGLHSMPTSGGLYYAAAVLAPEGWGALAAWITGWSNWMSQITAAPSVNYGTAAMLLGAVSIVNPDYTPQNYQVFLLTTFIMILHAIISSMPTRWIAQINSWGSTFNFVALIVVVILIPAATDRESRGLSRFTSSAEVWGSIYPGTDFPAGFAVLMSFVAVIWTMSGYDSPFHLAEECSNASIASPRAIVLTSITGGTFGFFLQLVVAYTVVDIAGALDSDLGDPYAAYLIQCLPQRIAIAILSLTIVAGFFMGQGCMIAASRVTFAYARDGCFPLSKYWARVHPRAKTPVNAVWINALIGNLLLLLIFAGDVAVGALFSIGAITSFVSFTIPIFIKVFFVGNRFRRGPWHLGRWSVPIGVVGLGFVALMVPVLCFPALTGSRLTLDEMNWTVLCYGAPMLFVMMWWYWSARHWFTGPKINVEHLMLGRGGNVVEGRHLARDAVKGQAGDGNILFY
ncbi:amino acid transporter [Pseudovirgaria hyperparasitica]|uniref:Amino acid transporter n=1 Tax=Pseudovirgaria hyperparasitica TaxID=470096 RepID=A0A6A6VSN2_9PEZI|nr:amino acid transporter [Pseudovirgaria hyperparasitica]KAF2753223.1 amino acid transporter [Pseudovirgaria hyperparasitica]